MPKKINDNEKAGGLKPDSAKDGAISKWYSPRRVVENWQYVVKFLDKTFKKCDVVYRKGHEGYDISKHRIYIQKRSAFARLKLVTAVLEMLIRNLIPGTRKVMYKDRPHLIISFKDIEMMAGRIAEKVYASFGSGSTAEWLKYVEKRYAPKVVKKPVGTPRISREQLSDLYYDKNLSVEAISKIAKAHPETIIAWMKKFELPTRRNSQYKYISPQKLDDLYYNQDFTLREIAKILDVSVPTILKKMKKYGMVRRDKEYDMPAWQTKGRAFKSVLRKKFRKNIAYVKLAKEVIVDAEKDPDLYEFNKEVVQFKEDFEKDK